MSKEEWKAHKCKWIKLAMMLRNVDTGDPIEFLYWCSLCGSIMQSTQIEGWATHSNVHQPNYYLKLVE